MAASQETFEKLYTCAYCPNTCRPSYSADRAVQIESQTPSALCLLALAVLKQRIPRDAGVDAALNRREAAMSSRGHCTYGLDIPALLDQAIGQPGA
jgi:hypothetical protein